MNGEETYDHRIATLETESKTMTERVKLLQAESARRDRPNYSLLALVVAISGGVWGVLTKDISANNKEVEKLDTKLQNEYRLINDTTRGQVEAVNAASKERFELNQRDVRRLEEAIRRSHGNE